MTMAIIRVDDPHAGSHFGRAFAPTDHSYFTGCDACRRCVKLVGREPEFPEV